jgi:hypothetical protein
VDASATRDRRAGAAQKKTDAGLQTLISGLRRPTNGHTKKPIDLQ